MKKLFFPLALICIGATIGCKKEMTTDNKVLSAASKNISNDSIATDSVHFGALVTTGTSDEKIEVLNKLGVNYVRASTMLTDFKGKDGMIDKCVAAGKKVILNLNYKDVVNKNPNPFPTDMVTYRRLLEAVLDKYAANIEVAVIENEPTTTTFHSGPIENYLAMLAVAIDVCHSYGVKVADGCVHVEVVQMLMKGYKLNGKALSVKKMITAYKNLPLDFVNVHTRGTGSSYPAGQLKATADYLRAQTGHPVMTNEWHLESSQSSLVESMVQGWKDGGYVYSIIYGGGGKSGNVAINNGTTLTSTGIAYTNAIP